MDKEEMRRCWDNDDYWSGGIYFCKQDPRLIIPKRPRWGGWTINFGHKWSTVTLIGIVGLPVLMLAVVLVAVIVVK